MPVNPKIRHIEPGDAESVVGGWNAIFPAQDGSAPVDLAWWDWKYAQNPFGRLEGYVAIADGKLVGHYGGLPQRVVDEGEEASVCQVVDAFVLPGYRRLGGWPGLAAHMAKQMYDDYAGTKAQRVSPGHVIHYGVAIRTWRAEVRYLGAQMVRDADCLFRELQVPGHVPFEPRGELEVLRVERGGELRALGDACWARCAPDYAFSVVRDGAWLDWRYAEHPRHDYEIYVARDPDTAEARGLAVYRRGSFQVEDAGILCDWLVAQDDLAAEDALLCALEERACEQRLPVLLTVFPQFDPRFLRFQRKGFLVGPTSYFWGGILHKHAAVKLRGMWFFQLGDLDLV